METVVFTATIPFPANKASSDQVLIFFFFQDFAVSAGTLENLIPGQIGPLRMLHWALAKWAGNGGYRFLVHDFVLLLIKWGGMVDFMDGKNCDTDGLGKCLKC
ncbi:MAG: hypothetical protein NDI81_11265 [Desulfobacula sp.]|nr:hypothetical protein [Desulfobacula sp.]